MEMNSSTLGSLLFFRGIRGTGYGTESPPGPRAAAEEAGSQPQWANKLSILSPEHAQSAQIY